MALMKTLQSVFCALLICIMLGVVLTGSFAARGQLSINTPQGERKDYPPSIEGSAARQDAVQEAWKKLLDKSGLPFSKLNLEPVLNTPRSLPMTLRGQISISEKPDELNEVEAKEAVQGFIARNIGILTGDPENRSLGLKDLSLLTFHNARYVYRAYYRQVTYPFQIANNYGLLSLQFDKKGKLWLLSSLLIPRFNLPANPEVKASEIIDRLLGTQFEYSSRAGQPQVYRVTNREEIVIKEAVIYPKLEGQKLSIHLAIPAEVGRSMTWDVYFDAITGQRIGETQNFKT
jgi:hypothetical protein